MLFGITEYLKIELGTRHWKTGPSRELSVLLIKKSNMNSGG